LFSQYQRHFLCRTTTYSGIVFNKIAILDHHGDSVFAISPQG